MPIYEYLCLNCQKKFENLRPSAQADAPLACQTCGSENVKRQLSVFYAQSGGHAVAGTSPSCNCGGCSGGNCAGCSH